MPKIPVINIEREEFGLLLVLLMVSIYMFIGSFEYRDVAGAFPRFFAFVVAIGSLILIIRNILPSSLQIFIPGTEIEATETLESPDGQSRASSESGSHTTPNNGQTNYMKAKTKIVTLFIIAYLVLSYLIGMLWATPVFAFVYLKWAGFSRKIISGGVIFVFMIGYIFLTVFNFPIDTGYIHRLLGVEF